MRIRVSAFCVCLSICLPVCLSVLLSVCGVCVYVCVRVLCVCARVSDGVYAHELDLHTAEIMLMSEGYGAGKLLARKFMMLYRLSEALLSPQRHYDWKLRAVKTTLCVAGGEK